MVVPRVRRLGHGLLMLAGLSGLSGLAGCEFPPEAPPRAEDQPSPLSAPLRAANADTARLYRAVETWFDQHLALNPVYATEIGDHRFDDRFGDYASLSWMADSLGIEQEALERLQAVDAKQLSGDDLVSYEAFRRQRELSIGGYRFPTELLVIDQVGSWPVTFALMGSGRGAHPFRSTRDYDNFLLRMDGFVAWVDQAINNLRAGVDKGVVLPKVVVQATLPQLEAIGRLEDPRQSAFWQPLLNFPAGPTVSERRRLLSAYDEKLRTRVFPAYRRLHDYLAIEYLPRARDSVGWSALPSGDLWYAQLVRQQTTLDLTPDAVHELGGRQVARLQAELAQLQPALGVGGDLRALLDTLRSDPRYQPASATDLLQACDRLRPRVEANLARLFARKPPAAPGTRAVEDFRAAAATAAFHVPPSVDGTRPGVVYLNTHDPPSRRSFALDSLCLREDLPGNHYRIALAQQRPQLPRFRRFGRDAGYSDGWSLYAATLGTELGVVTDPVAQAGALASELAQAALLVVDTGVHARGWERPRAIEYLRAHSALGETALSAEVDRVIARPAEVLAYTVGQVMIADLRHRAELRSGERFDLRQFHEQILDGGSLPLPVLESKVERWLAGRQ
jgi:uncharacterized protein (DUF885 family)